MKIKTKKKIIAIELVILFLISILTVLLNLDKLKNLFQKNIIIVSEEEISKQKEDNISEKITDLIQQLDEKMLLNYLKKIISFGPHPTQRKFLGKIFDLPIEKLRRYLVDELKSMDLKVITQSWAQKSTLKNLRVPKWFFGWFEGKNIEATLYGTDITSDEIYIITAHYDSWPRSPGANDDGSGVATILSIAKIMSKYSFNHSVCFLLVDGEEQGLLGSYAYSKDCNKKNKNIVAVVNIEDFGFAETEEGRRKIHSIENEGSCWITKDMSDNCKQYSDHINLEVVPQRKTEGFFADYKNFWNFGYDSVCCYEYEWDYHRHSPDDTLETINVPYLKMGARLLLATFAEWAWDIKSD